jgi:hypothetical protein
MVASLDLTHQRDVLGVQSLGPPTLLGEGGRAAP